MGALIRGSGRNREILRACFEGRLRPLVGQTLFLEYEDVLGRSEPLRKSPLSAGERRRLFEAILSVCEWVQVFYAWRPNLRDEGDNHLVELAVAGSARLIITNNVADFAGSELRFPSIRALRPEEALKEIV